MSDVGEGRDNAVMTRSDTPVARDHRIIRVLIGLLALAFLAYGIYCASGAHVADAVAAILVAGLCVSAIVILSEHPVRSRAAQKRIIRLFLIVGVPLVLIAQIAAAVL